MHSTFALGCKSLLPLCSDSLLQKKGTTYWGWFSQQVVARLTEYAHFYRLWRTEVAQQVVKRFFIPFSTCGDNYRIKGHFLQIKWRIRRGLWRKHIRLPDFAIIIEIRLPEAGSSITGSKWSEIVCIHLNGQWTDNWVILLIDALSCWQADDSSSNHCHPHVWINMRQNTFSFKTYSPTKASYIYKQKNTTIWISFDMYFTLIQQIGCRRKLGPAKFSVFMISINKYYPLRKQFGQLSQIIGLAELW